MELEAKLAREFLDYPFKDLPAIPTWLEWELWGNDSCPFARSQEGRVEVMADYADIALRECRGTFKRFALTLYQDGPGQAAYDALVLETDSWEEVLYWLAVI